ncbi:MAG: ACT domain-containing protein [Candidatus Nanopelagicales bacterium]
MTSTLTFTGHDRPGITAHVLGALGDSVPILDIEQLVVQGRLVLSVAVDADAVDGVDALAQSLGLELDVTRECIDVVNRTAATAVVVLMAPTLRAADIARVAGEIAEQGGNIERIVRIADYPVTAVEVTVSGVSATALKHSLGPVSREIGIDVAVQSAAIIRHGARLVVMDVDSTLIQDEVIDLLAREAGCEAAVAEVTERAMAGELDFASSLQQRVAALAGTPESALAVGARRRPHDTRSQDFVPDAGVPWLSARVGVGWFRGDRRAAGRRHRRPPVPRQPVGSRRRQAHGPGHPPDRRPRREGPGVTRIC